MLKKLYAYEYYSLFRSLIPIYLALITLALVGRTIYLFDSDSIAFTITTTFSGVFYVVGILALFVVGTVIIVTRFYKNLLGGEGYLTLTLPFTPTQHIVCKLLCAVSVIIINFIIVVLSLLIFGAGTEMMSEFLGEFKDFLTLINNQYSLFRIITAIFEVVIYLILLVFQGLLMFYSSMAIGQQFKSRIGAAVIAYICLYAAEQFIRNIFGIFLLIGFGDNIEPYLENMADSLQAFLLIPIFGSLALSVILFIVTRYFLTKKLNLE